MFVPVTVQQIIQPPIIADAEVAMAQPTHVDFTAVATDVEGQAFRSTETSIMAIGEPQAKKVRRSRGEKVPRWTTEEEERKAWAVDDAMAYGRRAGINYPGGSPVSPPAMRAKAAANGLATPTSLATPASLRTGQRKPKVGSAEWMQTVDKTRRSTLLSDAESGRSSAKRLEF